jgi:hypothetical protein
MEHELLRERSRITERHDAALRRWSPDRSHPELRRELASVVEALEKNLVASEAAGMSPLELSRTTLRIADACAEMARPQRIPHGEDRRWLLRALTAYHRACELLLGLDAARDLAVVAFHHANAIRRLDMDDVELLEAAKIRYEAALAHFEAHEPDRCAEIHEALDSLRVLLKIAPPARRAPDARAHVAEVKATLRAEENACDREPPSSNAASRFGEDVSMGLVNRVAEIVAALPRSNDQA